MRNLYDTTQHLTTCGNLRVGDEIDPTLPLHGLDAKGVTTIRRGTITSIQKRGSSIFVLVRDTGVRGAYRDKTTRILIAGPLFDSIFLPQFDEPALA